MLAAHQFRCHTSQRVTAWLDVGSNPIIEDCSGMVFGGLSTHNRMLLTAQPDCLPMCSDSATPDGAAAAAQGPRHSGGVSITADEAGALTRSAAEDADKWATVKDFNHVLSSASPNWRVNHTFLDSNLCSPSVLTVSSRRATLRKLLSSLPLHTIKAGLQHALRVVACMCHSIGLIKYYICAGALQQRATSSAKSTRIGPIHLNWHELH